MDVSLWAAAGCLLIVAVLFCCSIQLSLERQHCHQRLAFWHDNTYRTCWEGLYKAAFNVRYHLKFGSEEHRSLANAWRNLRKEYRYYLENCHGLTTAGGMDKSLSRLYGEAQKLQHDEPEMIIETAMLVSGEMDAVLGWDRETEHWGADLLTHKQRCELDQEI